MGSLEGAITKRDLVDTMLAREFLRVYTDEFVKQDPAVTRLLGLLRKHRVNPKNLLPGYAVRCWGHVISLYDDKYRQWAMNTIIEYCLE